MSEAISRVFGARATIDLNEFHGSTDRLIMGNVLRKANVSYDDSSLDSCLRLFGQIFPDYPDDIRIIPGVLKYIPILYNSHQLGLVTGNNEEMARKKLRLFKARDIALDNYSIFGAFGGTDPHERRSDLIELAIQRAVDLGWRGRMQHTFIVDDSQRGLTAALEARVVPIGVTTGKYSREDLRNTGVMHIVDNFRELPDLLARLCQEYSL